MDTCTKCNTKAIIENTSTRYENRIVVSKMKRLHCSRCRISWNSIEPIHITLDPKELGKE